MHLKMTAKSTIFNSLHCPDMDNLKDQCKWDLVASDCKTALCKRACVYVHSSKMSKMLPCQQQVILALRVRVRIRSHFSINCIKTWSMSLLLGLLRRVNISITKKKILRLEISRLFFDTCHSLQRLVYSCRPAVYSKCHASTCHSFTFLCYTAEHLRESDVFSSNCDAEEPKKQCKAMQKWKQESSFLSMG